MTRSTDFRLLFRPTEIAQLVSRYGPEQDDAALAAGRRIRGGEYTCKNLAEVYEWKTGGRGRSRLEANSDEEIADALSIAVSAKTERAAVAVLLGLHGIFVPVASAVLTAIDPAQYTVLDFRALEALGCENRYYTVSFYLEYLNACRRLAKHHGVKLRDLDRALWQWSSEKAQTQQG